MSHQEKQRIFDEYAKTLNDFDRKIFESFLSSLAIGKKTIREHVFAACDLVQEEQQKKIAEKSLVRYDYNELNKTGSGVSQKHFIGEGVRHYTVDKDSILNPENLIK